MKKRVEGTPENLHNLKQRLLAALAMLMVAVILTVATSYAWLTLSIAPEVSGIASNIGSNGSLEIALLNGDTYANPSNIKNPNIGESLDANSPIANERWGNLINLDSDSYGLQKITLYPARLNAEKLADGSYSIGDAILSIPSYGYDGRVVELSDNTVSGVYKGDTFFYDINKLGYGVRAIGTTNNLSLQANYLLKARGNISGYTYSAQSAVTTSFNGVDSLLLKIATGSESFTNEDVSVLKAMISGLKDAEEYIEKALRQGLVAYAAAYISDENAFEEARAIIMNDEVNLSTIVQEIAAVGDINESFVDWASKQEELSSALARASALCENLTDDNHAKTEIYPVLAELMDTDKILFNGKKYSEVNTDDLLGQLPITITLVPGSGVYADVADFTGNYEVAVGNMANLVTVSAGTAHLSELLSDVNRLTAAGGGLSNKPIEIGDVYGYALDLAFRCNAFSSDLLLQTAGVQRVYDDSESGAIMGGGSYMEFVIKDTGIVPDDMVKLMDAIRLAFVDNQGNILSVAKLNTSNRDAVGDSIRAPLYLYEYSIPEDGEDAGKMVMGERRKTNNTITSLGQNTAKVITAVVWLDGDLVDNTMVSAEQSLNGVLNLQFASSVDLSPMSNEALLNYTTDKSLLTQEINTAKTIYDKGKQNYTANSWKNFAEAYAYADQINKLDNSTPMQVQRAGDDLREAVKELNTISTDALKATITNVRNVTGKTNVIAGYVLKQGTSVSLKLVEEGTLLEALPEGGSDPFYRVDYSKNLHDEGNEYLTRIYTDESWCALAELLYEAEGVAAIGTAAYTEAQIEELDVALNAALVGLQRSIYYQPFEHQGHLYYKALTDERDTYGKWYDDQFKRVVADLTILNLDAYAQPISIVKLGDGEALYVPNTSASTTVTVELQGELYASLKNQTIIANNWKLQNGISFVNGSQSPMISGDDYYKVTLNVPGNTFNVNELYTMPYQALELSVGTPGSYTMTGILLTDAGVLFECEEVLNVYAPASGVAINGSDINAEVGDSGSLNCALNGGTEEIDSVSWYLHSGSAKTVSINEHTGAWVANAAGTVKVCVQVTTVQGNTYVAEPITVNVNTSVTP